MDAIEISKETQPKIGYKDVLSQKEYLKIIIANIISRFGDSIDSIAFTWLVYEITGKASWSAIIFALNQLPGIFIQPFAGALVEGMNKKKLILFSDIARGTCVALLAFSYINAQVNIPFLVVFTLIISSVEAFCMPARMALIPKILDKKYYDFGVSLNATASTFMQFVGLGTAGFIIGYFGVGMGILIDGITFFGSALLISLIRYKEPNLSKKKLNTKDYFITLKEGFQYLKGNQIVKNFCLMAVFLNGLLVPLNALQTPLVVNVLGQSSELLSFLGISLLIGMGLASFLFPYINNKLSVAKLFTILGTFLGICYMIIIMGKYMQDNTLFVYLSCFFSTFGIGFSTGIISTVLSIQFMKAVKEEYLARVGAIFNAGACAAAPVVSLLVGFLALAIPVEYIFLLCGFLCVILFLIITIKKVPFEDLSEEDINTRI